MSIKEDYAKPLKEIYEALPEQTRISLDKDIAKVWFCFGAWAVLTLLSLAIIACLVHLNPLREAAGVWFQRSGSLISLVAVVSEALFVIKLSKLVNITHPAQLTYEIYLFRRFKSLLKITVVVTSIILVSGTLIWGYGDLLW